MHYIKQYNGILNSTLLRYGNAFFVAFTITMQARTALFQTQHTQTMESATHYRKYDVIDV